MWDRSYEGLRLSGLAPAVVDWLELSVGQAGDEARVVAAFLFVMSLEDTRVALLASGKPVRGFALKLIGRLLPRAAPANAPEDVDLQLAGRIAAQLADMRPDSWPPGVFAHGSIRRARQSLPLKPPEMKMGTSDGQGAIFVARQ